MHTLNPDISACQVSIENYHQLKTFIGTRQSLADNRRQRALLVLGGAPAGWCRRFADENGLPFLSSDEKGGRMDRSDKITALLGSENQVLIFSIGKELDAGLLAAAAGTVRVGGTLILELDMLGVTVTSNKRYPDGKLTVLQKRAWSTLYRLRFERLLLNTYTGEDSMTSFVSVQINNHTDDTDHSYVINLTGRNRYPTSVAALEHDAITEQDRLLAKATEHLTTHERACVLITGRRGRGKSTLLARIANWLVESRREFAVTSKHESALLSFRHHHQPEHDPFISYENIQHSTVATLLVDEASNFSINQLSSVVNTRRQLVFCATSEGYENAGRAFIVRFAEKLRRMNSALLVLQPDCAWRWLAGDHLEDFIDKLLLAHQHERAITVKKQLHNVQHSSSAALCRRLSQTELTNNENLLFQVHSLLAANHYQNSAKDLQHMLDGTSLQVWVQQIGDVVVAALIVEIEGNIDPSLHSEILNGKRRLPHQLLPQMLAQRSGQASVLNRKFARVVRIAVTQHCRRERLASRLIRHLETILVNESAHVQAIGASFADDKISVAFWQSLGYAQFHRGLRINPRSGTQSIVVLKSWDSAIDDAVSTLNH